MSRAYCLRLFAIVVVVANSIYQSDGMKFKLFSRKMGNQHVKKRTQVHNKTRMSYHPHISSLVNWERQNDFVIHNSVPLMMSNGVISVSSAQKNPVELPIDLTLVDFASSWEHLEQQICKSISDEPGFELKKLSSVEGQRVQAVMNTPVGKIPITYNLTNRKTSFFAPNSELNDIMDGLATGSYRDNDLVQKPCIWKYDLSNSTWINERVNIPALEKFKRPGYLTATVARTGHADSCLVIGGCLIEEEIVHKKRDPIVKSYGFYQFHSGENGLLPSGKGELTLASCVSENGRVLGGCINDSPVVWFYQKRNLTEGMCPWQLCILSENQGAVNYICPKGRIACGEIDEKACIWVLNEMSSYCFEIDTILVEQGLELDGECKLDEVVWISPDYKQLLINGRIKRDQSTMAFLISLDKPAAIF